jgi:hypothetical protein
MISFSLIATVLMLAVAKRVTETDVAAEKMKMVHEKNSMTCEKRKQLYLCNQTLSRAGHYVAVCKIRLGGCQKMQSICVHSEKSQKTVYKDHYLEVASLHLSCQTFCF